MIFKFSYGGTKYEYPIIDSNIKADFKDDLYLTDFEIVFDDGVIKSYKLPCKLTCLEKNEPSTKDRWFLISLVNDYESHVMSLKSKLDYLAMMANIELPE